MSDNTKSSPHTARYDAAPEPVMAFVIGGGRVDLLNPEPKAVDFRHIAAALSVLPRFNGATGYPAYSVAQHTVLGVDALLDLGELDAARAFLLHDAHEAYIGDQTRPQQKAFDWLLHRLYPLRTAAAFSDVRRALAQTWDLAIYARAGLSHLLEDSGVAAKVRQMDETMLAIEMHRLFGAELDIDSRKHWIEWMFRHNIWHPADAQEKFLDRLYSLTGIRQGFPERRSC